jgi:site-specific recombinase XerD
VSKTLIPQSFQREKDQNNIFTLRARQVNRLLDKVFAEAGLTGKLSSHSLRKSFGTLLNDNGASLPVIQELLGHADISTTRKYIGVGMDSMTKAVNVLAGAY